MPVQTAARGSYAAIAARATQSAPARALTVTLPEGILPAWQPGKPAPAWMAQEHRCRILPAGPMAPLVGTSNVPTAHPLDPTRRVTLPEARAFCKLLPATAFDSRTGLPVQAPPSFTFFHIRPFAEGNPGLGSDGMVRSVFHLIGARMKAAGLNVSVPQFVPVHEVARGWSLVFCRSVDAPAMKAIVKQMQKDCFPDLEYDGGEATHLYSDAKSEIPVTCAALHRIANLALDLSTVDLNDKRTQARQHVGFRHASLRLPDAKAYQTVACVLLRFVLNRAATLPPKESDVDFLLRAVCHRHAVDNLVETREAMDDAATGGGDGEADYVTAPDCRNVFGNGVPAPATSSEIRRTALGEALRKGAALTHKDRAAAERHARGNRTLETTGSPANDPDREKRSGETAATPAAKRPLPPSNPQDSSAPSPSRGPAHAAPPSAPAEGHVTTPGGEGITAESNGGRDANKGIDDESNGERGARGAREGDDEELLEDADGEIDADKVLADLDAFNADIETRTDANRPSDDEHSFHTAHGPALQPAGGNELPPDHADGDRPTGKSDAAMTGLPGVGENPSAGAEVGGKKPDENGSTSTERSGRDSDLPDATHMNVEETPTGGGHGDAES